MSALPTVWTGSVALPVLDEEDGESSEATYGIGAVDELDLAAELESSGLTERSSRRYLDGLSLFDVAARLFSAPRHPPRQAGASTRVDGDDLVEAIMRALLLACGLAIVGTVILTVPLPAPAIAGASSAAWIGGQAVGSVLWARRGVGDFDGGVRVALRWATVVVLLTAIGATCATVVMSTPDPLQIVLFSVGLQLYSVLVAIAIAGARTGGAAMSVVLGGLAALVAWIVHAPESVIVAIAGATLLALAVVVLTIPTAAPRGAGGPRIDLAAAIPAVVQAAILAGGLILLAALNHQGFTTTTVLAITAGVAVADPLLTSARWRMQHRAATFTDHDGLARQTAWTTILACTVATAVTAVALVVFVATGQHPGTAAMVLLFVGYGAQAVVSTALRTFGAVWLSVLVAVPAVLPGLLVPFGAPGILGGLLVCFALDVLVLGRVLRDPRAYM